MGQYWKIYNESKKEMLNPWDFDEVAKLHEWPLDGPGGMQSALVILLLEPSSLGDGGGDFDFSAATDELRGYIGHWRGDAISIVGDYSLLPEFSFDNSAEEEDRQYHDISKDVYALMQHEPYLKKRGGARPTMAPDMVFYGKTS